MLVYSKRNKPEVIDAIFQATQAWAHKRFGDGHISATPRPCKTAQARGTKRQRRLTFEQMQEEDHQGSAHA